MTIHAEGRPDSRAALGMRQPNRLMMVSNRGPLEHRLSDDGQVTRFSTDGGVATALSAVADSIDVDWLACAATSADVALAKRGQKVRLGGASRLTFVAPQPEAYELFYNTLCNPLLWFLQHGIWDQIEMPNAQLRALHAWQLGYLPVNQAIADQVCAALSGRIDRVTFHDYHFYLAPMFVRHRHPEAVLQHFIHIPWPDPAQWMNLPRNLPESICRGLLANDSVVFQTPASADNFMATCHDLLPEVHVDFGDGAIESGRHRTRVWANPISVDPVDLHRRLQSPEALCAGRRFDWRKGQTIVRVDRLDPSKNVLAGFEAYERLLEAHPEWRDTVRFLAFLVPSRSSIPEYASYAERVFLTADRINRRFGTAAWRPVQVFHENDRVQALAAMRRYDVLLVNSIADGMNLVAKEGCVLNETGGVLVLSRAAGCWDELGAAALGIDPADIAGTAQALHEALAMPATERYRRAETLRAAVLEHQLLDWTSAQLEDLGISPLRDQRQLLTPIVTRERLSSLAS